MKTVEAEDNLWGSVWEVSAGYRPQVSGLYPLSQLTSPVFLLLKTVELI